MSQTILVIYNNFSGHINAASEFSGLISKYASQTIDLNELQHAAEDSVEQIIFYINNGRFARLTEKKNITYMLGLYELITYFEIFREKIAYTFMGWFITNDNILPMSEDEFVLALNYINNFDGQMCKRLCDLYFRKLITVSNAASRRIRINAFKKAQERGEVVKKILTDWILERFDWQNVNHNDW